MKLKTNCGLLELSTLKILRPLFIFVIICFLILSCKDFDELGEAQITQPVLFSPADNATDLATRLVLVWKRVDWNRASGILSYCVQVSTDSQFIDNIICDTSDITGKYKLIISDLSISTNYYWRVNASSGIEISEWSEIRKFTTGEGMFGTPCPNIPTVDYSGKTYNTVKIWNQCWLKENLNVGVKISRDQNPSDNGTIEKYCYNDSSINCDIYGGLYSWDEAMQYTSVEGAQGICPPGWHIPTYDEYFTLFTAIGDDSNPLKAIGQGKGEGAGTNTSGFSALLAGQYVNGIWFDGLGIFACIWMGTANGSEHGFDISLFDGDHYIFITGKIRKHGLSIRCIKD